jgi:TonB family protein
MFERLVVSSANGPKSRISRFMVGSAISYVVGIAIAITGSILTSNPILAGLGSGGNKMTAVPLASGHSEGIASHRRPPNGLTQPATATSASNTRPTADTSAHLPGTAISAPPTIGYFGSGDGVGTGVGDAAGSGCCGDLPGVGDGREIPAPQPPRPVLVESEKKPIPPRSTVRVSGQVLQGKALTKITPEYPTLARSIHVGGPVAVEVVISQNGQVESAHAISGHPLLMQAAVEAAKHWRFEPTLLSGVAVRVTGVITFVFKLD